MKTLAAVLVNVLVKRFYIINAGFFLFLFFLFFGIVNGGQLISYHQSLILAMITSPVFMGAVWIAWLLYNMKCILFCINTIKAAESSYLYSIKCLPALKQMVLYLLVGALQFMPVLAYSCFVVAMALNRFMLVTAMLVIAFQFIMISMAAFTTFLFINKNSLTSGVAKFTITISKAFAVKLGYNGFLLGNILYEKKMAFAVVKIFSILLLSVSFVINGDHFDADLFSIFFQLLFVGHAILVFYCVDFAESLMQFSRNLPVALHKVAGRYLFTYSIILLPEVVFMFINNHGNLPATDIGLLYLTAVCTLFLYTAILYGCNLNMEGYMLVIFVTFITTFFLQKTGLQLVTVLAILVMATVVFKTNYYSFERE